MSSKAFNELTTLLLDTEDKTKFEWAIGALLAGDVPHVVVLQGDARTGKTTLTSIVRKILSQFTGEYSPRTAFLEDDGSPYDPVFDQDTFVFFETNRDVEINEPVIVLTTTGDRIPVNKHYVLMQTIDSELAAIAQLCVNTYHRLGGDYYEVQENNR